VRILILKTGALGDVLRTTSILPGLHRRHPGCEVTWVTARSAEDLVAHHPLVHRVHAVDPGDGAAVSRLGDELAGTAWDRVLSFDDEAALCALATKVSGGGDERVLSGAWLDGSARRYTEDVAPWFDMGLLSVHGKERADRLKVLNRESHAEIYARMLGIEMGHTELPLTDEALAFGAAFTERTRLHRAGPVVGLNTGAGGRWTSKCLPVDRTVELATRLSDELRGAVTFLVLGGPDEASRNEEILRQCGGIVRAVDAGTGNSLLEFAALVDRLDLLVTSDSLALHVGVARRIPVLAFFAPTSAAEIELYGLGDKVTSTTSDYCSYRPDADTSTLSVDRLLPAALRLLSLHAE
jgi:heptosyltransferase-2